LAKWRNSELLPAARQYSRDRGKLQNFLRKKKPVVTGENDHVPARIPAVTVADHQFAPSLASRRLVCGRFTDVAGIVSPSHGNVKIFSAG
jgi:hypothetical protein